MATSSPNLGLHLTPEASETIDFRDWSRQLTSDADTSNMMIIDEAIGSLDSELSEQADDIAALTNELESFASSTDTALENMTAMLGVSLVSATLSSTSWVGTVKPYTQTVSVPGLGADQYFIDGLSSAATPTQRVAARKAVLSRTGQAAGSITITADGTKPSIDIPIALFVFGDLG